MKPQQAAVLFSFVLSCANALPSVPAAGPASADQAAREITQLITRPDEALDQIHGMPSDMKLSLTGAPGLYDSMLTAGAQQAYRGYMKDVTNEHSSPILGSILGFRNELASREQGLTPEVKARRLAIYHDSIYSRLVDLQKAFPKEFETRSFLTTSQLHRHLNFHLANLHQASVVPMGEKADVEEWLAQAKELQAVHAPEVRAQLRANSKLLPPAFHLDEFNYVSQAEVLDKLRATGANPHNLLVNPLASRLSQLSAIKKTTATEATQLPAAQNKPAKAFVTEDHLKQAFNNVNKENAAPSKLPTSAATADESPLKAKTGSPISVAA